MLWRGCPAGRYRYLGLARTDFTGDNLNQKPKRRVGQNLVRLYGGTHSP